MEGGTCTSRPTISTSSMQSRTFWTTFSLFTVIFLDSQLTQSYGYNDHIYILQQNVTIRELKGLGKSISNWIFQKKKKTSRQSKQRTGFFSLRFFKLLAVVDDMRCTNLAHALTHKVSKFWNSAEAFENLIVLDIFLHIDT